MSNRVISSNFKKLRINLGLSQEQMAQYLDKSREEISYYETSKRDIPLSILEKSSNLFGIELSDFFSETNPEAIAFAFRADQLSTNDLEEISKFKKIMKNYSRINRLINKH